MTTEKVNRHDKKMMPFFFSSATPPEESEEAQDLESGSIYNHADRECTMLDCTSLCKVPLLFLAYSGCIIFFIYLVTAVDIESTGEAYPSSGYVR